MTRYILFLSVMVFYGCAETPITEQNNSVVCWRAIYQNEEDAKIEAAKRFSGGINSTPCMMLADRHQAEVNKAYESIGKDLGTILKNTTR